MMKKILYGVMMFMILGFITSCADNLTPLQKDYEVMARFTVAQIAAEKAVTSPSISPEAKRYIKLAEKAAREAVLAYDDAVRAGDPNAAKVLPIVIEKIGGLIQYLIANGWIKDERARIRQFSTVLA